VNEQKYERLLTKKQVAEMLNCSIDTIKRLENLGKFPRVQISGVGVRYKPESIKAYIDRREIYIKPKY
jgi:predicted DNA-binding transcriptional regulator AlpA